MYETLSSQQSAKLMLSVLSELQKLPKSDQAPILINITENVVKSGRELLANERESLLYYSLLVGYYNACCWVLPQMLTNLRKQYSAATAKSVLNHIKKPLSVIPEQPDIRFNVIEGLIDGESDLFSIDTSLYEPGQALIYLLEPGYLYRLCTVPQWVKPTLETLTEFFAVICRSQQEGGEEALEFSPEIGPLIGYALANLRILPDPISESLFPESFGVIGESERSWASLSNSDIFALARKRYDFLHDSRASLAQLRRLSALSFPYANSGIIDGVTKALIEFDNRMRQDVATSLGSVKAAHKVLAQKLNHQKRYLYAIPALSASKRKLDKNGNAIPIRNSTSTLLEHLSSHGLFFTHAHLRLLKLAEENHSLAFPTISFHVPIREMATRMNVLTLDFFKFRLARELNHYNQDGNFRSPDVPSNTSSCVKGVHSLVNAIKTYLFLHSALSDWSVQSVAVSEGAYDFLNAEVLPYLLYAFFGHLTNVYIHKNNDISCELEPIFRHYLSNQFKPGTVVSRCDLSDKLVSDKSSTPVVSFTPSYDASKSVPRSPAKKENRANFSQIRPGKA